MAGPKFKLRADSTLFRHAASFYYYCMTKVTQKKAKSAKAAPSSSSASRRKKACANTLSMAQFLIVFNLQKSPGPGPSSQPPVATAPGTSSSLPEVNHIPFIWNAPAWPTVGHPAHAVPSFTTVNSLQAYPTFAATSLAQAQHDVGNLEPNVTTSPVPFACHVTQSAELFQPPANTVPDPSPRSPPELPSSGSEADHTPSRGPSSKRIRVSRRNPMYGFVEGAMVGNKERGETFSCSLSLR